MHRLFVAIRPPGAVRSDLLDLMDGVAGARWQDDDQLHLTLRFIGEVDRHCANDIAAALGALRHPGLEVALNGVGSFERRGRADALWAGVAPHAPLARLHAKIDRALVAIGLAPEGRAYLPHITLARLGRSAAPVDAFVATHASLKSAPFAVTSFCLYESHLGRDGAVYEIVERYPLS